MSQNIGQTITRLLDYKVNVAAFHSKDSLTHKFTLILENLLEKNEMNIRQIYF